MSKAKHLRVDTLIKKTGSRIRYFRLRKNMTMSELSIACNIEYAQLSNIELGISNTSISHFFVITKALDISLSELFDFEI